MWLTAKEMATKLNVSESTVRGKARKGLIEREKTSTVNGGIAYLYLYKKAEQRSVIEDVTSKYMFLENQGMYLFFGLPNQLPSVKVSKVNIEWIVESYSNEGSKMTLNEIARETGLPRASVRGILSALGKTHDSLPFTDEEIVSKDEDSLVSSLARLKEGKVSKKAESVVRKRASLEKDRRTFLRDIISKLNLKHIEHNINISISEESVGSHALVIGLTDLHIGKLGVNGYNSRIAVESAINFTRGGLEKCLNSWGTPEKVYLTCGSDMFNIDSYDLSTTRGTRQDVDVHPSKIIELGYELMDILVSMLKEISNVEVICISGNHDRLLSVALGYIVKARFKDDEKVNVTIESEGAIYKRFHNSLLGFNHGDSIKLDNLPHLMAKDCPKDWGECNGAWDWFTGHRHGLHLSVKESSGCRVWTMPSLSGTDRWHKRMGYTGNRKELAIFRVDSERGVGGVELVNEKDLLRSR